MNCWSPNYRNEDRKEDNPPFSRIFIVCSKALCEEDLRPSFEKFGKIEDLYMPKDRKTGQSKGIMFIKYNKASSAAAAIEEMHMKVVGQDNKPLKVIIASNKHDENQQIDTEKFKRLFIKVPKDVTEKDIRDHFENFAHVESVYIQRDKVTDEVKGCAYVVFKTFLDAAQALDNCDRKYKPMFATPKDDHKRHRKSMHMELSCDKLNSSTSGRVENSFPDYVSYRSEMTKRDNSGQFLGNCKSEVSKTVSVTCVPMVEQRYVEKLFNIIPGMTNCQYSVDPHLGISKATITYSDGSAAAHAVERIDNYEFPSGELICVKIENNPISRAANDLTSIVNDFRKAIDNKDSADLVQLADAIAHASTLIKAATSGKVDCKEDTTNTYCSVPLPPKQPFASNSRVAQRCFIVCKPQPPPLAFLRDVFCRFGDLIDVSTFPNKTFGFVKYASVKAAQEAIKTLNGAFVHGIMIKVMEANEKSKDDDETVDTDSSDCLIDQTDRKRMKFSDRNDYK